MRVMLFVQTGDARPVACPTMKHEREALMETKSLRASAPTTWNDPPDRWWLVECENADAGRRVIRESNPFANLPHTGYAPTPGRILASGGAK